MFVSYINTLSLMFMSAFAILSPLPTCRRHVGGDGHTNMLSGDSFVRCTQGALSAGAVWIIHTTSFPY